MPVILIIYEYLCTLYFVVGISNLYFQEQLIILK